MGSLSPKSLKEDSGEAEGDLEEVMGDQERWNISRLRGSGKGCRAERIHGAKRCLRRYYVDSPERTKGLAKARHG